MCNSPNWFVSIIIIFFALINNLKSQDTLILNKIGHNEVFKKIGTVYHPLNPESISLKDFKFPRGIKNKKRVKCSLVVINDSVLQSKANIKPKYLLVAENESKIEVYENYNKNDFYKAKQILKLEYKDQIEDFNMKLLTKDYNIIEMSINLYNPRKYNSDDTSHKLKLMFYTHNIKYGEFKYQNDKVLSIGLNDDNLDGKIESDVDYYFCNRTNTKFFNANYSSKMSNKLSKHNYLFIDSLNIFEIKPIKNSPNKLIIKKVEKMEDIYHGRFIKIFNSAPLECKYDSLNAVGLKINELFNKGKYVYIDIATAFCPPCIKNLPKLDSLAKVYDKKITILTLLDKDPEQKQLYEIIKKHKVSHPIGWCNKQIRQELNVNGYPYGVLFDNSGKLIDPMDITELTKFCNDTFGK